MDPTSARTPTPPVPLSPADTPRWVLPALVPLITVVTIYAALDVGAMSAVLSSFGDATLWGATLVAGLLVMVLIAVIVGRTSAVTRRELVTATAVTAGFVMLTSVSGRLLTLPLLENLEKNWQGKILDLLWVAALFAVLHRWARTEAGLRLRLEEGSARPALSVVLGVLVLFIGLGVLAVATGEGAVRPVGPEQLLWDATLPNLTEELIWRGAMLAVLDRAFPPSRRVLGARMGWGAVITAVVFALGHAILLGADGSWSLSVAGGVFALAMGVAFAWIRARTGSIWPAFALHCAPELGADLGVILGT